MNIRRLATIAALGATALGSAHAVTVTENFDTTNSFSGGTLVNVTGDGFLMLSHAEPSASRTFWFDSPLAQLTLGFWFSGPFGNNGTVSFDSFSAQLGNTPGNAAAYLLNNPGPDSTGTGALDSYFETTLYNLAQGNYTLTFSKAANRLGSLKIDDVTLAALPVPEPETYTLMLAGLGVVGWLARRRRPNQD